MKTQVENHIQADNPGDDPAAPEQRCQTGIAGLDDILGGGLPKGCFYLVQGDPGSGKTTLALQFLLEGRRRGERGLYVTLSETRDELTRVAHSHGWSLEGIPLVELSQVEHLVKPEAQTVFRPSEMDLKNVANLLLEEARRTQPARVVFDSLSEFRLLAETPLRYRHQLLALKQRFAEFGSTVLLLDDKMDKAGTRTDPHVMSLSHGVLEMEQRSPDYGIARRRLRAFKVRGIQFREGWHDYLILKGGLQVFPRLVAAEHHTHFERKPVSSGIEELDQLFGGGLECGTTTLIMGPAGSGKSTLALQYVAQGAKRGQRALVYTFDETLGVMLTRARGLGLSLDEPMEQGLVQAQQVDPAELSPGEFASRVRHGVEAGAELVLLDSLNGYLHAMPGELYLLNQLHELASFLNQRGVLTILILAQHGLVETQTSLDVSYLADTVVLLRYFECEGAVRQALSILKKRTGHHEKTIREFKLEPGKGLRIGRPLTQFQGVLGHSPGYVGSKHQAME